MTSSHTTLPVLPPLPRLIAVGTATPPEKYSQDDILAWSGETDPKIQRLFRNSHIQSRHLYLPERVDGRVPDESPQQLIDRHRNGALEIGPQAITRALTAAGLTVADVGFLVCMTSTGFLCPSLTAHLIKHMGFREDVMRMDLVGMGCNAAVNGLQAATAIARARPSVPGLLVCIEVCSAAYVINRTMSTAVVNSLFGDGAAAAVIRCDDRDDGTRGPGVVDFEPFILTEAIGAMRYDLEGPRLSFFLERDIPFVIGRHGHIPVERLLARHGIEKSAVKHWLIHSGGKKVIDALARDLGLDDHAVRHTRSILEQFGNVSSGSVLFSYERLRAEGVTRPGDIGVLIAMGPGTSIETALLRW